MAQWHVAYQPAAAARAAAAASAVGGVSGGVAGYVKRVAPGPSSLSGVRSWIPAILCVGRTVQAPSRAPWRDRLGGPSLDGARKYRPHPILRILDHKNIGRVQRPKPRLSKPASLANGVRSGGNRPKVPIHTPSPKGFRISFEGSRGVIRGVPTDSG